MKPELKAKWVEALRSGEFKQGKGRLYDARSDSYCCLGVLAVSAGAAKELCEGRLYLLGSIVGEPSEFGITELHEMLLAEMNDGSEGGGRFQNPKTFAEIADWIEENL